MPNFTKQAIIDTFLKLLSEKPLSRITVKEIVEECGINRNSFYYHFADINALIDTILKDEVNRTFLYFVKLESLEDCLLAATDFVIKNKSAAMHLYQSASRAAFEKYLDEITSYVAKTYVDTASKEYTVCEEDKKVITHFYKCELAGFLLSWIQAGMQYDIQPFIKRVCQLFYGTTKTAFERSTGGAAPPERL